MVDSYGITFAGNDADQPVNAARKAVEDGDMQEALKAIARALEALNDEIKAIAATSEESEERLTSIESEVANLKEDVSKLRME